MKVLFAASEAYPFAMSGGLADVAGSLPKALRKRLIGCRVVMPLYSTIPPNGYIYSQEVGSSDSTPCRLSSVRPTYLILNTFSKLSILPSSIGLDMQGLQPV